jgi:hypothetical protein
MRKSNAHASGKKRVAKIYENYMKLKNFPNQDTIVINDFLRDVTGQYMVKNKISLVNDVLKIFGQMCSSFGIYSVPQEFWIDLIQNRWIQDFISKEGPTCDIEKFKEFFIILFRALVILFIFKFKYKKYE